MEKKDKFDDDLNLELLKKYSNEKSLSTKNKIVVLNQPLVSYIISKYYNESIKINPDSKQDMFQEGIIGLMTAIDKFDTSFECKFSTYATWWVKQKINNYLSLDVAIQVPNHIKADQSKLNKLLKIEGKTIGDLNEEDIEKFNITNKKLKRIKSAITSKKMVSLQSPVSKADDSYTFEETIMDQNEIPDNSFDKKTMIDTVKLALKGMPEKRRLVLLLRYGVVSEKDLKKAIKKK